MVTMHQFEEIQTLLERHFETLSKEYKNIAEERQRMQMERDQLLLQLHEYKIQNSRLEIENKQLKQTKNTETKSQLLGIRRPKTNPLLPTNPLSQSTPFFSTQKESSKFKENLDDLQLSQSKKKQLYYLQKAKLLNSSTNE